MKSYGLGSPRVELQGNGTLPPDRMNDELRLIESPPSSTQRLRSFATSVLVHLLAATALWFIVRTTVARQTISLTLTLSNDVKSNTTDVSVVIPVQAEPAVQPIATVTSKKPHVMANQPKAASPSIEEPAMADSVIEPMPNGSVDFFGVSADGERFVYIIDNSYSMDARSMNRYRRACDEVLRSVGRLESHQSYSVFLFGWETAAMFHESEPRYQNSTGDHVADLRVWLTGATLGPGTDPRRALSLAARMNPDAIFFLTDGDFNEPSTPSRGNGWLDLDGAPFTATFDDAIDRLFVAHGVPINTFAFENPFATDSLRQIASQTGGTYQYVKTNDLQPLDRDRFEAELKKVESAAGSARMRLRIAKELIRDGELVYAESIARPIKPEELRREQDRGTLEQIREIFKTELGDLRLEDFAKPL